jgi:hypothetical protein
MLVYNLKQGSPEIARILIGTDCCCRCRTGTGHSFGHVAENLTQSLLVLMVCNAVKTTS